MSFKLTITKVQHTEHGRDENNVFVAQDRYKTRRELWEEKNGVTADA